MSPTNVHVHDRAEQRRSASARRQAEKTEADAGGLRDASRSGAPCTYDRAVHAIGDQGESFDARSARESPGDVTSQGWARFNN